VGSNLVEEDSDMNNSITKKPAIVYFDPRLKFCTGVFLRALRHTVFQPDVSFRYAEPWALEGFLPGVAKRLLSQGGANSGENFILPTRN